MAAPNVLSVVAVLEVIFRGPIESCRHCFEVGFKFTKLICIRQLSHHILSASAQSRAVNAAIIGVG
jgi:hypothetical protein